MCWSWMVGPVSLPRDFQDFPNSGRERGDCPCPTPALPPQAPSIRISCSPTSSIHHSQTGRGRRKETSIASELKLMFFLQFLTILAKVE